MELISLNNIDPAEQFNKLKNSFENLAEEHYLVISNSVSNSDILKKFQAEFWGKYDLQPLIEGPVVWKSRIFKRQAVDTSKEDIQHFMSIDHALCDSIYAQGEDAVLNGNTDEGKELLLSFALCMERHFIMEEDIFFPAFEQRSGITNGPTQVMRMEHDQMRNVLRQIGVALDNDDFDTVIGACETMLILMQQHNMKEEGMLYPMADSQISDISEDMLKTMQLLKT